MHSQGSATVESPLTAWLALCRLPNVFTALADVLVGWFFVTAVSYDLVLGLLLAASACLYTAGMVLNDVFDLELDRRERPSRPLPSGRVDLPRARALGWGLLTAGVAWGWLPFFARGLIGPGVVASLLAACVVAYDARLKDTLLGPAAMGMCRALNVLLGMSVAMESWDRPHFLVAGGLGLYVAGVTLFAQQEAGTSARSMLGLALGVIIGGAAMMASVASTLPSDQQFMDDRTYWLLIGLVTAVPGARCLAAIVDPQSRTVQRAVKQAIVSIIFLDASVCALVRGVEPAMVIIALVVPTIALGRFIYST